MGEVLSDGVAEVLALSRDRKCAESVARARELVASCDAAGRPVVESCRALVEWRAACDGGRFIGDGLTEAIAGIARLREAGYEPLLGWAQANAGYALGLLGDFEAGIEWLEGAIADARQRDDRRQLVQCYSHLGSLLAHTDELDRATSLFSDALDLCEGQPFAVRAMVLNNLSYCDILRARRPGTPEADRAALAQQALQCATEAVAGLDAPVPSILHGSVLCNQGLALTLLGRLAEAEAVFLRALPLSEGAPRLAAELMTAYAEVLIEAGRYAEAADQLERAKAQAPEDLVDLTLDRILELQIRLARLAGRGDDAQALWERRFEQAQSRYRGRLRNVRRHTQVLAELEQTRRSEQEARAQAAALRDSEEKFRLAFANANTGMCLVDLDGRLLQVNDKMTAMLGYGRSELETMTVNDLALPEDAALSPRFIRHAVSGGADHAEFEKHYRHRDGHVVHALVSSSLVRGAAGEPRFFISQVQDVTERQAAEAELRQRTHILEVAQDAARMGYYVTDLGTGRWSGSPMLYQIMGIDEGYERTVETWSGLLHPDDRERATTEFWSALERQARLRHEYRVVRPSDGKLRWVEAWGIFEREDGVPVRLIGTVMDTTERKEFESALRAARDAADLASRAKGQFLAHMSHEIRTPMNSVVGIAQLLEQEALSDDQARMVRLIHQAGESLLQIINDILDLSKIESGQMQIAREPYFLALVVDRAATMFREAAHRKGLYLNIKRPADATGRFLGDALRLEQVLLNLVGNAIKFTERGGVEVEVLMVSPPTAVPRFRFEIRDTGIGIDPDVLAGLFAPFAQADSSITRRYGGTGLGLAISKALVEQMGGEIGASSDLGVGSTFWFEMPLPRAPDEAAAAVAGPGWDRVATTALAGMQVLAVDDNRMNQFVVERMLQRAGAEVVLAGNGREALEILEAQPQRFDAVLMDVQMPVMDGLTAIRAIRSDPQLAATPVVALTAGVLPEEREAALAAGADGFVPKPVEYSLLAATLAPFRRSPPGAADAPPAAS